MGRTQSARGTIKPWCCAPVGMTGRVCHPPRRTQSAWSVEGAFCGVAGRVAMAHPVLWRHHHKRGRSAPLQRPRLGSSPHRPHPVQREPPEGVPVATSAHPVPRQRHPPTVDTQNRRPAPLSGHQMHRFVRDRGGSPTHTDPARRVAAAPRFRCGYAVLEGARSRAILDTIDTLDMGVREWTERTRQRERVSTAVGSAFSLWCPCPLSLILFDHVESVVCVHRPHQVVATCNGFGPRHWCLEPCRLCLSCPTPLQSHTPSAEQSGAYDRQGENRNVRRSPNRIEDHRC